MKALSLSYKLPVFGSALALTLLIGTLTASALQVAKDPSSAATAPAKAGPGLNTLTPTAPMSSLVPTEEDIRDIRQPRHIPTLQAWAVAAVGVLLLGAAGLVAWRWTRRGKLRQLLPHEIALQSLEEARQLMDPEHAREYCFAVSNIIRRYVEESFHVHAPRLTTEEFLRDLVEVRDTMLESHRALLAGRTFAAEELQEWCKVINAELIKLKST